MYLGNNANKFDTHLDIDSTFTDTFNYILLT